LVEQQVDGVQPERRTWADKDAGDGAASSQDDTHKNAVLEGRRAAALNHRAGW
jgi:hypothetical protein